MKMKIRMLMCLMIFFASFEVKAQDPVFTQYMLVPETINAAFTGIANAWNAGILNRRQWPDADRRMDTRFGYANFMVTDQLAAGGTVLNHHEDFTGYNFFQFNAAASYRVELDSEWRLRMGLEA